MPPVAESKLNDISYTLLILFDTGLTLTVPSPSTTTPPNAYQA